MSIKPDETEQLKTKADPPPSAYIDKLGRVYPVDTYGSILRKTSRPFGVTTEQWTKASRKQKTEYVEAFAGVLPRARVG